MGRAPLAVDILPEIDGIDFEEAWPNRVETIIDPESGLKASFISSTDLIVNKLAAGRLQDLADVASLRDAAKDKKYPTVIFDAVASADECARDRG
jgi:hypothetical protein